MYDMTGYDPGPLYFTGASGISEYDRNERGTAPFQHRTNTMRLHLVLSEMWWNFNFAAGNSENPNKGICTSTLLIH